MTTFLCTKESSFLAKKGIVKINNLFLGHKLAILLVESGFFEFKLFPEFKNIKNILRRRGYSEERDECSK